MTIRPTRPGGMGPGFVPTPAELAQIDYRLAKYGLDAVGGDTITGPINLAQDPLHTGTAPTITGSIAVSGAGEGEGSVVGTGSGGGQVTLATTVPTFSAARTRKVRISALELAHGDYFLEGNTIVAGCVPVIDPATGGIQSSPNYYTPGASGTDNGLTTGFIFPITKPMNGAEFSSVVVYFYIPSLPEAKPSLGGEVQLQAINQTTGLVTTLAFAFFGTPASPVAWYNNGAVQSVSLTGLSTVVNLSEYTYHVMIYDVASSASEQPTPIYTGIEINYANVLGEGFTQ